MTNIVRKKYAEKGKKKRSTVRSDGEDTAPRAPTDRQTRAFKHTVLTDKHNAPVQCMAPSKCSLCSKFSAGVPTAAAAAVVMAALDRYRII